MQVCKRYNWYLQAHCMMHSHLRDEKFINKINSLATQKPTEPETRVSVLRREIPNIERRPHPMSLEAFKRQRPNNHNAAIQAAFAICS